MVLVAVVVVWLLCKLLALIFTALGAVAIAVFVPLFQGLLWAFNYVGPLIGGAVLGAVIGYLATLGMKRSEKVRWLLAIAVMLAVLLPVLSFHMHIESKLTDAQKVFDQGDLYRALEMRNEALAANHAVLLGEWRTDGLGNAWYIWWPWAKYREPQIIDFTPRPEW